MLDRDKLNSANLRQVATGCVAVVDAIQDRTPEEQVLALAAAFVLLAEAHRIPAQDVFTTANNLMVAAEGRRVEFAGVDHYIRHEIVKD